MEKGGPSSPPSPVSSASSPEELERPVAIRPYDTSDEDIDNTKKVIFFGEHACLVSVIMEKGGPSSPSYPVSSASSPEELECAVAVRPYHASDEDIDALYDTSDEEIDDRFLHGGEYVPDDTVPDFMSEAEVKAFVLEAEAKADAKLKQVRKKLEEVRAQGWQDAFVSIETSSFDDAYYYLKISTDPDGYDVRLEYPVGLKPEVDIQYVTLLKRLLESPYMSRHLKKHVQLKHLEKLATGLSQLTESLMRDCLEDYILISANDDYIRPFEKVHDELGKLHKYLLQSDSDAKTLYFSDCEVLKQKLKEMFPNIRGYTRSLLDYVVRWWRSESEKDEKEARRVFDRRLQLAHDDVEDFRRANLSKGLAAKYKLEIARRVGIIGEFPDEIANYRLPRECKWPDESTEMELCTKDAKEKADQ